MMKLLPGKIALLLFFACGLPMFDTCSQAAGWGYPAMENGYGPQMSQQQIDMAREIITRNYAAMEDTRQELASKRAQLDALLASPNPDGGKIEELSRDIGELRGKMLAARADVRKQLIQKGLSPDFLGPDVQARPEQYGGPHGYYHHDRPHHGRRGYGRGYGCGGCW